jgi:hypothetical protein
MRLAFRWSSKQMQRIGMKIRQLAPWIASDHPRDSTEDHDRDQEVGGPFVHFR